jgi:hypothetical protein
VLDDKRDATENARASQDDDEDAARSLTHSRFLMTLADLTGPAAEFGPMPSSIYLYVPDCDAVYQQATCARTTAS